MGRSENCKTHTVGNIFGILSQSERPSKAVGLNQIKPTKPKKAKLVRAIQVSKVIENLNRAKLLKLLLGQSRLIGEYGNPTRVSGKSL